MNIVSVIVIFVILFIVALTSKKHSNIFLAFGLIDIFLRLINYIGNHTIKEVADVVNKIFPDSIAAIITHYTSGTLCDILMWGYILLMVIFFIQVTKLFIKRY
jgi:hypothetical protein